MHCAQQAQTRPAAEANQGARASWQMCSAICSVPKCLEPMFELFGPVPLDFGCQECEQEAGDALSGDSDMLKNFTIWEHLAKGSEYGLMIRKTSSYGSNNNDDLSDDSSGLPYGLLPSAARFLATSNRLVGGLLITQTRKTARDCSGDRFGLLETKTRSPSSDGSGVRQTVRTRGPRAAATPPAVRRQRN